MKNKKVVILVLVIIGAVLFLMGSFVHKKNQDLENKMDQEEKYLKEDKKNDSKDIKNNKREGSTNSMPDKNNKDIREKDLLRIKSTLSGYLYDFKFLEAHEYLYNETLKYNQESIPEDIKELIRETSIMSNFEDMLSYGENKMVIDIVKDLNDIDSFLVSTLYLKSEDRRYILESTSSINPVFYGGIELIKKEDITENYKEENIKKLQEIDNIEKIYKHEFIIEGNRLWSYIVKTDGKFRFVKITQDKENEVQYYTIEKWDKTFN